MRASGCVPLLLAAVLGGACAPMPPAPRELGRASPVVVVGQRLRDLSRLTPEVRQALCSASTRWAPIERKLRMGGPIDRADANSQKFLNALYAQIAAHFAAPSAHQQALLLVPVSIALQIVRHEALGATPLLDAVVRSGDRLYASASSGRDD